MNNRYTRRGFTLIELLVVVLIIGILAAIALPQYQKAVERARTVDAITRVKMIERAIELAVLEHGGIPAGELIGGDAGTSNHPYLNTGIDLMSGLNCFKGKVDDSCYNDAWMYSAYCDEGSSCHWSAYLWNTPKDQNGLIVESSGTFNGQTWSRSCWYESSQGERICNTLNDSLKIDDVSEGF